MNSIVSKQQCVCSFCYESNDANGRFSKHTLQIEFYIFAKNGDVISNGKFTFQSSILTGKSTNVSLIEDFVIFITNLEKKYNIIYLVPNIAHFYKLLNRYLSQATSANIFDVCSCNGNHYVDFNSYLIGSGHVILRPNILSDYAKQMGEIFIKLENHKQKTLLIK